MTGIEIVRQYFPEANEEFVEHVLWSHTGYPSFCPAGTTPEEHFGKQIKAFKKLYDAGKEICEFCNSEAVVGPLCKSCHEAVSV